MVKKGGKKVARRQQFGGVIMYGPCVGSEVVSGISERTGRPWAISSVQVKTSRRDMQTVNVVDGERRSLAEDDLPGFGDWVYVHVQRLDSNDYGVQLQGRLMDGPPEFQADGSLLIRYIEAEGVDVSPLGAAAD